MGTTLAEEYKTQLEIGIYNYISTFLKNTIEFRKGDVDSLISPSLRVRLDNKTESKFIFNIIFDSKLFKSPLDTINLKDFLIAYMRFHWAYIYESETGIYYIILYETIKVQSLSKDTNGYYNMIITVDYLTFDNPKDALALAASMNENQYNPLEASCEELYGEYKIICDKVWNLPQTDKFDNMEVLEIITNINNCINKRKHAMVNCKFLDNPKHQNAIYKLKKKRKYYVELLIKRLNSYLND